MKQSKAVKLYMDVRSGEYLRLIKLRESGVNTFLQVDAKNKPIIKKRCWCIHPSTQSRIVTGFDHLELISL